MLFRNHALVAAMAALCTMFCVIPAHAEDEDAPRVMSTQEYAAAAVIPPNFTVKKEDHHDTLPSLRNAVVPKNTNVKRTNFEGLIPLPPGSANQPDGAIQSMTSPTLHAPSVSLNFDGVGDGFTGPQGTFNIQYAPPDTDGAVGATQYVSLVNTDLAVFDKTSGNAIYGPVAVNTLWSGFGGGCESNNDGDGVVIYDRAANRWVISQFSVSTTPYLQCVAVSQTSDATGAWNRYSFDYGNTDFPDYPKMGSWPDAYYETFNVFAGNSNIPYGNLCAYDRTSMLAGNAATQQCFQLSTAYAGILPSDLDGTTPPPAGAPNYLINYGTNSLNLWKFHVDWTTPANSTLTGPTNISVPSFSPLCNGLTCVTQPGTTNKLDSLADRMMFRLAYRNFGDHESLVASHSVKAGTKGGVRWYELRNPGGTPTVYQASTFAPDTTAYRWMPSIAMDSAGDIALGYSVSTKTNPSIKPSVAYTGRTPADALNTMQTEVNVITGNGVQTGGLHRWGDYSAMTVDPVDDCTFWYTNEYIPSNGSFNWKTRIASFKFPGCGSKQNQTITFTSTAPAGAVVGGATYTPTATASSGLTVTLTIDASANSVCSISGGVVSFTGVGNCVIDANQAGNGTYNAAPQVQQSFAVAPGAPAQLILSSVADGTAGVALAPAVTVTVEDASGNVVVGDTNSVTLSIASGPGAFDGASTVTVSFSNGVATFSNLVLDTAGNYTLSANDGGDSLNVGSSNTFAILAATPDHLVFTPTPGDIMQGQALGNVTVTEYDAFGNEVTSDSTTQISLVAGSCGGTVLGTQPLTGGVVTFNTTQSFMTVASGVNLSAAAGASPPTATASTFDVTANTDILFADGFDGCRP